MRRLTCSPSAEVMGFYIRAFSENMQGMNTAPIMDRHGMGDVDPHQWYSAKTLLDALNDIGDSPDGSSNLVAIGMEIGRQVPVPPDMTQPTLEKMLWAWDDAYQMVHRNADVGAVRCEKISETHIKTIHTHLYPDDLSYGIIYGYARRFLPPGTHFKVYYDPEIPSRDGGGKATIIHVSWE